jgi:hypothetical protein
MPRKTPTEKFIAIEDAARHLAPVCLVIAEQYKQTHGSLRSHLKITLKWLVRDLERYVRPKASSLALAKAAEMGIEHLQGMRWADQPKRMSDPGRKIFHWEHVTRVADVTDAILCLDRPSVQEVEKLLNGMIIAWILKEEDRRLPPGFRADPTAVYEAAGIILND